MQRGSHNTTTMPVLDPRVRYYTYKRKGQSRQTELSEEKTVAAHLRPYQSAQSTSDSVTPVQVCEEQPEQHFELL